MTSDTHELAVAFLTPGIVMMTALMNSGWSGTTFIADMERGVMDRMLASPVSRGGLMAGQLISNATTTLIQTLSTRAFRTYQRSV